MSRPWVCRWRWRWRAVRRGCQARVSGTGRNQPQRRLSPQPDTPQTSRLTPQPDDRAQEGAPARPSSCAGQAAGPPDPTTAPSRRLSGYSPVPYTGRAPAMHRPYTRPATQSRSRVRAQRARPGRVVEATRYAHSSLAHCSRLRRRPTEDEKATWRASDQVSRDRRRRRRTAASAAASRRHPAARVKTDGATTHGSAAASYCQRGTSVDALPATATATRLARRATLALSSLSRCATGPGSSAATALYPGRPPLLCSI